MMLNLIIDLQINIITINLYPIKVQNDQKIHNIHFISQLIKFDKFQYFVWILYSFGLKTAKIKKKNY